VEEKGHDILQAPLVVISVGVRTFADSFERQGVEVTQVDWVPPAGGDPKMIDLLEDLL
jgi:FdrA protein